MQKRDGRTLFSAGDVVAFQECEHTTTLALIDLETRFLVPGPRPDAAWPAHPGCPPLPLGRVGVQYLLGRLAAIPPVRGIFLRGEGG